MSDGTFTPTWLENHRVAMREPVTADAIVGIGHVLEAVRGLLGKLRNPELMASLGAEPPRGILFHGRPGTGKTLVARYLASELGADVPMYELSADELTPARVRKLFSHLAANHDRCVLYLDEIDLVALNRNMATEEARKILVALLAALDGIASTSGPILIASSNRPPMHLDPALMRPGRIGVHVPFDVPDEQEREALFKHFLGSRPISSDVDFGDLATQSAAMTPAEIRGVVDDATGLAVADARVKTTNDDLRRALRRGGVVLPEEQATPDPDKLKRIAIHEAGHIVVAVAIGGADWVRQVTIREDGGETALGQRGASDDFMTAVEVGDSIIVGFGGIAAEEELYGSASMNSAGDVERATTLACMLARIGQLDGAGAIDREVARAYLGVPVPDAAASVVTATLVGARRTAAEIVHESHAAIHRLADILGEREGVYTGPALHSAIARSGLLDDWDDEVGERDEPEMGSPESSPTPMAVVA